MSSIQTALVIIPRLAANTNPSNSTSPSVKAWEGSNDPRHVGERTAHFRLEDPNDVYPSLSDTGRAIMDDWRVVRSNYGAGAGKVQQAARDHHAHTGELIPLY